jgi:hypothetical protein
MTRSASNASSCSTKSAQNQSKSRRESIKRFFKLDFKKQSNKRASLCIDKNQIGSPIDFVHVNHVGLSNNDSGLDVK